VKRLHGVPHFLILFPPFLLSHFYVPLRFAHSKEDADQYAKWGAMFLLPLPGVVRPPLGGGWTVPWMVSFPPSRHLHFFKNSLLFLLLILWRGNSHYFAGLWLWRTMLCVTSINPLCDLLNDVANVGAIATQPLWIFWWILDFLPQKVTNIKRRLPSRHNSSSWRSRGLTICGWDIPLHSSEPEASLGEDPHSEVTCIFIFVRTAYAKNT
jgi:hypothetical protein